MKYPWDDGTRDRQERLLVLIAVCLMAVCIAYLVVVAR